MPEVAIYQAADMNAFATGWNRNNALVAALERLKIIHEQTVLPEKWQL